MKHEFDNYRKELRALCFGIPGSCPVSHNHPRTDNSITCHNFSKTGDLQSITNEQCQYKQITYLIIHRYKLSMEAISNCNR